ncbi:uncharacterized protein [Eleutherodactylus coqui]|uniref:uncharacterized protein n=1 Tax=Eleutherodactylus coqui TaxID=57060 RepID=UPI003463135E
MRHLCRRLCFYVLLATGLVAPAEHVTGPLNGRVTLPCTYSLAPTSMCWGRGSCSLLKCNDAIIWTDGHKVTWKESDRYQLLGIISHGDVSLTITGATKEDEGTYCCRVEIRGLFNDKKKEVTVEIHETTSPPKSTNQPFHHPQEFPLPTGSESPYITPKTTSANFIAFTVEQEKQKNNKIEDIDPKLPYIVAGVVTVIILISLAALLYRYRHCKRINKDTSSWCVKLTFARSKVPVIEVFKVNCVWTLLFTRQRIIGVKGMVASRMTTSSPLHLFRNAEPCKGVSTYRRPAERSDVLGCRQEMRHLCRRLCFYVLLATGLVAPAEPVTGPLNGRVTLPCTYSFAPASMCWGRGKCPLSKCSDAIIWTDGHKVTWKKLDRYQLLGNISHGDVSLTITGATKEDEGTYCCRVEIRGLFNDKKKEVTVEIHETTSPPEPTDQPFHTPHEFPLPTGSDCPYVTPKTTSANLISFTMEQENQQNNEIEDIDSKLAYIVTRVVIFILISLAALLYSYRPCKRMNKDTSRVFRFLASSQDETEQHRRNPLTIMRSVRSPLSCPALEQKKRSPTIISLEGLERTQD